MLIAIYISWQLPATVITPSDSLLARGDGAVRHVEGAVLPAVGTVPGLPHAQVHHQAHL